MKEKKYFKGDKIIKDIWNNSELEEEEVRKSCTRKKRYWNRKIRIVDREYAEEWKNPVSLDVTKPMYRWLTKQCTNVDSGFWSLERMFLEIHRGRAKSSSEEWRRDLDF